MGSTPIESTPAGGNSCGAHLSVRSMHLEMRISREGRKVNDLTTPCTGLALWTLNGFNKAPELQPISGWLGSRADEGRAKLR